MADQLHLYPTGLTRAQFDRLAVLAEQASGHSIASLQSDIQDHVSATRIAYARNRLVNLRLAVAIAETMERVAQRWEPLPASARYWLAGAIRYFVKCNDDEPDFGSPIGFEDDAEVLNACLRFANLGDLVLRVEDFDGA